MARPLDVLTDDEVGQALNGIDVQADWFGALYASAVSQRLDDLCGPIVARQTVETHPGGSSVIVLRYPATSLVSVTTFDGTTTTTVASGDLVLDPDGIVDYPAGPFLPGPRAVTVTYNAGRFVSTETVSEQFKLAAIRLLQGIWRPAEGAGPEGVVPAPPAVVLDEVKLILGREIREPRPG